MKLEDRIRMLRFYLRTAGPIFGVKGVKKKAKELAEKLEELLKIKEKMMEIVFSPVVQR